MLHPYDGSRYSYLVTTWMMWCRKCNISRRFIIRMELGSYGTVLVSAKKRNGILNGASCWKHLESRGMKNMFITRCFDAWVTLKTFTINALFTVFPALLAPPRLWWIIYARELLLWVLMLILTQMLLTVSSLQPTTIYEHLFPRFDYLLVNILE